MPREWSLFFSMFSFMLFFDHSTNPEYSKMPFFSEPAAKLYTEELKCPSFELFKLVIPYEMYAYCILIRLAN